jgi:hypothetical protein
VIGNLPLKLQGRFITATRKIEPGEIIAIDKPQIRYLDPEFMKVSKYTILKHECFTHSNTELFILRLPLILFPSIY